jgi:tellurite resistance protein TerC
MSHMDWIWIGFFVFIIAMLALDLGVLHRRSHVIKTREAIAMSVLWIGLALAFNVGIWIFMGSEKALEFTAAYTMEKALSIDNLFVFVLVFSYFCVPDRWQYKVLFWGVIGALVFRGLFIVAGIALVEQFSWMLYIFGIFLIITSLKMILQGHKEVCPDDNLMIRIFRRIVPVTKEFHGDKFFVRVSGVLMVTPLFLTMLFVEFTDVVFAIDSIPAVLAISTDPFVVYTSNAFAILGLRSLYFALASALPAFRYLKYGLAAILTFVGVKMLITDLYHITVVISLLTILGILTVSILASIIFNKGAKRRSIKEVKAE